MVRGLARQAECDRGADTTHLTTPDELEQHITLLVSAEESDALFVTFYLNLADGCCVGSNA